MATSRKRAAPETERDIGPARPPPSVVWASVADLDTGVSRAEFEALFKDDAPAPAPPETAEKQSVRPRPASTVEEINREFRADPVEAVRQNINYHIDPVTLQSVAPEIQEIAVAHDRQERVADAMWLNDDFRFYRMVQGLTGDNTLVDRELEGPGGGNVLLQPTPLSGIETRPFVTSRPDESWPMAFRRNLGQAAAEYYNRGVPNPLPSYDAQAEQNRVVGNLDRLMSQPAVSGQITLSSGFTAAIDDALVRLFQMKPGKYGNKERRHFFRYPTIMSLFAQVVADIIIIRKMPRDGQYHQSVVEPRRKVQISYWLDKLDNTCQWDAESDCFRVASPQVMAANATAKYQRLLDAFNPDFVLGAQKY